MRAEALCKIVRKQNRITKPRHKGLCQHSSAFYQLSIDASNGSLEKKEVEACSRATDSPQSTKLKQVSRTCRSESTLRCMIETYKGHATSFDFRPSAWIHF